MNYIMKSLRKAGSLTFNALAVGGWLLLLLAMLAGLRGYTYLFVLGWGA